MRKMRIKYYVVILLATLSLTSVGFASWMVSDSITSSTSGLIVVDDVLKVNDFITCSSEDINKFSYFKNGFVNDDGCISTTGNITTYFKIDMNECKNEFSDCNTLIVELNLQQEDLKYFNQINLLTYEVKVKQNGIIIPSTTTSNDSLSITTLELPITTGMTEIVIQYTFTILNIDYFKTTIYPLLLNKNFNFTLSAKLTGKKVSS